MFGNKEEQRPAVYRVADEPDAAILSRYEITPNSSGPIQKYLEAIAQLRLPSGAPLVSVILFGSAAKGAFTANVSDVDLIVVLPDTASQDDRRHIQEKVLALEIIHGFRMPSDRTRGWLEKYIERCTGYSLVRLLFAREAIFIGGNNPGA